MIKQLQVVDLIQLAQSIEADLDSGNTPNVRTKVRTIVNALTDLKSPADTWARIEAWLNSLPEPLALDAAIKTYDTEFFRAERNVSLKILIAEQLWLRFNRNDLWRKIAQQDADILHIM